MKSKYINTLLGAALFGFVFSTAAFAQGEPPAATVNENGDLVLNPGTPQEQIIPKPTGSVDASGNLVLDSGTITKPTATLLPDGSLDLGNGTILPVPQLPGGNAVIDWMNQAGCAHRTVQFDNTKPLTEAQQHWSYSLKAFYQDPAITPFVYMFELGAWVYMGTDVAGSSMCGVWAYGFDFPKAGSTADGTGTWFYLNIGVFAGEVATGAAIIDGWLYLNGGSFNDWYKLKEFPGAAEPGTYLFQGANSYRLTTN